MYMVRTTSNTWFVCFWFCCANAEHIVTVGESEPSRNGFLRQRASHIFEGYICYHTASYRFQER